MPKRASNQVPPKSVTQVAVHQILSQMPQRLKSAFQQIGRDNDALCWKIGDKVAETFTWTRSAQIECTIMDACIAASILMDTDYSAFRVYDFYLVAEKLPKASHRKLVEPLPFSHLLWARQYTSTPEAKVTFLEIVNMDIQLLDSNQGKPRAKYELIEEVTGKKTNKKAPAVITDDAGAYISLKDIAPDTSVEEVITSIFDAVAGQSVMYSRILENFSRGTTLTRELISQLVEDMVE